MRTLIMWLLLAATLIACGGDSASPSRPTFTPPSNPGGPVAATGTTSQDLRVQLEPVGTRRVNISVPVDCDDIQVGYDDDAEQTHTIPLRDQFAADVLDDGTFTVDESYVEDEVDGNHSDVDVHIKGAFTSDGTASGIVEASYEWYNGQGGDAPEFVCSAAVDWNADQQPDSGVDTVEVDDVAMLVPDGPDILAITRHIGPETERESASIVPIDHSGTPSSAVPLELSDPDGVYSIAYGRELVPVAGGVWIKDDQGDELVHIDLESGQATTSVRTGLINALVAGHNSLWTLIRKSDGCVLERRDPRTGRVADSVPSACGTLAASPFAVWHIESTYDARDEGEAPVATRIDPGTLEADLTIDVDIEDSVSRAVATEGMIWLLLDGGRSVVTLNPVTSDVNTIDLPSSASALAADEHGAWLTHPREDTIRRIEDGEITTTVDVPGGGEIAVTDDGTVWLAGGIDNEDSDDSEGVVRLDPKKLAGR